MTFRKRKATPPTRSAAPQMQNAASALPEVEEEEEEEQQQNAQGQADNDYDDDDHDDDEEEDGEEAAKEKDEPEPEVSASDGVVSILPFACACVLSQHPYRWSARAPLCQYSRAASRRMLYRKELLMVHVSAPCSDVQRSPLFQRPTFQYLFWSYTPTRP